jgi:hypothetical protein
LLKNVIVDSRPFCISDTPVITIVGSPTIFPFTRSASSDNVVKPASNFSFLQAGYIFLIHKEHHRSDHT